MKTSTPAHPEVKQLRRSTPAARAKRTTPREFTLDTILAPTDFSPPSLKALKYAGALAKQFRAKLHLINVFDAQFVAPRLAPVFRTDEQVRRRLTKRMRTIAAEFADPLRPAGCHVRIGRAFDEICSEARRLSADLIVTGTRGYTGLKHLLLGSTAQRIIQHAPCPVLVVRAKEREFVNGNGEARRTRSAAFRLRHILVPTDFSEQSRAALHYAIAFTKQCDAKITLLNVIYPQYFATNANYMAVDFSSFLEDARRSAREEFKAFVHSFAFEDVPFETHIREGHPGDRIVAYGRRAGVDLIINATHGRTGLAHVLLGSTAEHVVRYGSCPVLVVPTRRNQAARRR
jgi:nucleotide-binding universal stress UspA family protein